MNIIDTRDLEKRKIELEELRDAVVEAEENLETARVSENPADIEQAETQLEDARNEFGEDEERELKELEELSNEISEWTSGNQLIPESDFEDFCRELCEDVGDIPKDLPHYIVIDWSATSQNIMADYSQVEFQGETYLVRNS